MADVTIDAAASTLLHDQANRGGIFWVSTTVGYAIYIDNGSDLVYSKTADGGANWAADVEIEGGGIEACDCWADWQTDGDAGTKIHIVWINDNSDSIRYAYLDTDGDSIGGEDTIEVCQGTGTFSTRGGRDYWQCSITKTRGGNLAVAFSYEDSDPTRFESFYTSPDGDTWTSKNDPFEGSRFDYIQLYAGNETDNQDLWAAFWDASDDEISLKTFDNSGNSWSEQSISGSMVESATYLQMDGQIRLSDGHLIFAAWSQYDNAASDLKVWDINGAGSITAKTNIITNEAESFTVSVFINQVNDDIYVTYVSGTAAQSLVKAFYDKSDDGGGTWGGETAMQANAEADIRWVSAGCIKAAWGGKFLPIWFNDDANDIFCNTDNAISIAAAGGQDYPISTTCGLTASATVVYLAAWDRSVAAGLTTSATVLKGWGRKITTSAAGLTASATVAYKAAWDRSVNAGLTASATVAYLVAYDRSMNPRLTTAVTIAYKAVWDRSIAAGLTVATTIVKGWGRAIATSADLVVSATVAYLVAWDRGISTGLTASATVLKGWGRTITTSADLTISATVVKLRNRTISTSTGLTAAVSIAITSILDWIVLTLPSRSLAMTLQSRSLAMTLKVRSLAMTLKSRSLAMTLKVRSIIMTLFER